MSILLQISIEVNSGSVGRIAEQIGEVAIDQGWMSYITYARNHRDCKSKLIKIGTYWDVCWHGLMTRLFDTHCLSSTRATKNLIKQIEQIQPDIIQLHHIHGYFLNMKVLFRYLSSVDIPVVWVFHDCWSMTGHCAHFDYVGCYKWQTQCNSCVQKTKYPGSYLLDRSFKNYILKRSLFTSVKDMTLVPVSHWLEGLVKESFFKDCSNVKIRTIHNGVDIDVFKPQPELTNNIRNKYGIADTDFMAVACATTWEERKGIRDYIEIARRITPNIKVVMVGVSDKIKATLPKNIIALSRTENISELVSLYSTADVVLNLSYEETFGLTTIEGFACGTPAIVYNATASPELISEDTGYIVEKGDVEGVIVAIQNIAEKGKASFSWACRNRAVTVFSKKEKFQEYIDLYESLLKKHV